MNEKKAFVYMHSGGNRAVLVPLCMSFLDIRTKTNYFPEILETKCQVYASLFENALNKFSLLGNSLYLAPLGQSTSQH